MIPHICGQQQQVLCLDSPWRTSAPCCTIHTRAYVVYLASMALCSGTHQNNTSIRNRSNWRYTSADVCNETLTPDCFFRPLSRCQVRIVVMKILYTHHSLDQCLHKQYMADRIGADTKVYDISSGAQSNDQLLHAPRHLITNISDWSTKGIPWWRAQTTR